MAKKQLYGAEIARPAIDQGCLRPADRMRPVRADIKPKVTHPGIEYSSVLASSEVIRFANPARKQVVVPRELGLIDPCRDGVTGRRCDFELNRPMGLLLHDRCPVRDLAPVADFIDFELQKIASPQLAVDAQIEEGQFASTMFELQADAKRPDLLAFERRLLSDDLSLVPRGAVFGRGCR